MRWLFIRSIAIWVQIPVQLLLELEANWLDKNVNELEFELSRMYMKQPLDPMGSMSSYATKADKRED